MLYCPKYSIGSEVVFEVNGIELQGTVINIDATFKANRYGEKYTVLYLIEVEDVGAKRVIEDKIKDSKRLEHASDMDKFLADLLLLTRHKFPEQRIDNSIKELLKFDAAGGKSNEHDDLLQ